MKRKLALLALVAGLAHAHQPPINIDLSPGEHTGTTYVNCDGDRVNSIDIWIDGKYVTTAYALPPTPTGLSAQVK